MSYQKPKPMRGHSKSGKSALYFVITLLLLIPLAISIGVFILDSMSRSSFNRAWNQIVEMEESGSYKSNVEIQELIGHKPAEVDVSRRGSAVERYTWKRGIPTMTYDIYVVYSANTVNGEQQLHYYSSSANAPPTSFPSDPGPVIIQRPDKPPGG